MMREMDMDIDRTKDMELDTYNRHGHGYQAWTWLPGMDMVTGSFRGQEPPVHRFECRISDIGKKFNPISDVTSDCAFCSPISDRTKFSRPLVCRFLEL
jgi:hypothetical protein